MVSMQWFVRTEKLAAAALDAERSGAIRINPKRFAKVYQQWLDGIEDWCVLKCAPVDGQMCHASSSGACINSLL